MQASRGGHICFICFAAAVCTRSVLWQTAARQAYHARAQNSAGSGEAGVMTQKATILIVDDEPDVREVLEEYLVAHGFTAVVAESAAVARACAAQQLVDLALVDIHMPGEDGLSLA